MAYHLVLLWIIEWILWLLRICWANGWLWCCTNSYRILIVFRGWLLWILLRLECCLLLRLSVFCIKYVKDLEQQQQQQNVEIKRDFEFMGQKIGTRKIITIWWDHISGSCCCYLIIWRSDRCITIFVYLHLNAQKKKQKWDLQREREREKILCAHCQHNKSTYIFYRDGISSAYCSCIARSNDTSYTRTIHTRSAVYLIRFHLNMALNIAWHIILATYIADWMYATLQLLPIIWIGLFDTAPFHASFEQRWKHLRIELYMDIERTRVKLG